MSNRYISPLTIAVPVDRTPDGSPGFSATSLRIPLLLADKRDEDAEKGGIADEDFSESLEYYVRRMVSHCALSIRVPYHPEPGWLSHKQLKSMISPSLRDTITFIDRNSNIWNACKQYLEPLQIDDADPNVLDQVGWNLYLVALSAKQKGEVALPPEQALQAIIKLQMTSTLSRESKARLAKIERIFKCFDTRVDCPSLLLEKFTSSVKVVDFVEEILEDAYLLEASGLRRFFGLHSNKASIQRDLRKLLAWIASNRAWAKGFVRIGSQTLYSGAPSGVIEQIAEVLPTITSTSDQPVLTGYDTYFRAGPRAPIQIIRGLKASGFRL